MNSDARKLLKKNSSSNILYFLSVKNYLDLISIISPSSNGKYFPTFISLQAARRGQELLQQKLDVLLIELSKYVKEYVEQSKKVSISLKEVYFSIITAKAFSDQQNFHVFTNLMKGSLDADVSFNSVMGISFPQITVSLKNSFSNFYSIVLNLSPVAEKAFSETENVIAALIKLIELQQIILALAEAIRSTKVRVNSLKYYVIPSMEQAISFISLRISEMEREEFYRIKKIKSKILKSERSLEVQ